MDIAIAVLTGLTVVCVVLGGAASTIFVPKTRHRVRYRDRRRSRRDPLDPRLF